MNVVKATASHEEGWNSYVYSHPKAHPYHLFQWKSVIEDSYGLESHYLCVLDEGNNVQGILPLFKIKGLGLSEYLVSLPFCDYAGVLASSEEASWHLLQAAYALLTDEKVSYLELRHIHPVQALQAKTHKATFLLPLSDVEESWKNLDSKVRNQIRKAEKNELKCFWGKQELLDDFFDVYSLRMKELGSPQHSRYFFERILYEFPENSEIIIVRKEGATVAGGFTLIFEGIMEMPWASSAKRYFSLNPNNKLYWDVIARACNVGCQYFDFGRSDYPSSHAAFKMSWGCLPTTLHWQYLVRNGQDVPGMIKESTKVQVAVWSWKKMPLWLTQRLGPVLIKRFPVY